MPLPAEVICQTCHGDLYWAGPYTQWAHVHGDDVQFHHVGRPMTSAERMEYEAEIRRLMEDVPLITREEFLRGLT